MGLDSSSVIKIADLFCEGPIDGIEGNKKGVFLMNRQWKPKMAKILEADQVSHELRIGSEGQSYLPQAKGKTRMSSTLTSKLAQNTKRI